MNSHAKFQKKKKKRKPIVTVKIIILVKERRSRNYDFYSLVFLRL
jgi:hypothetical protein